MRGRFFKGKFFNKIAGGTGADLEHLPENSSIYFQVQDCAAVCQPHLVEVIVKSVVRIDGVPEGLRIEGIIDRMGPTTKVVMVYCSVTQSGWITWDQQ